MNVGGREYEECSFRCAISRYRFRVRVVSTRDVTTPYSVIAF